MSHVTLGANRRSLGCCDRCRPHDDPHDDARGIEERHCRRGAAGSVPGLPGRSSISFVMPCAAHPVAFLDSALDTPHAKTIGYVSCGIVRCASRRRFSARRA